MSAAEKLQPLTPRALAMRDYQDGEGQDANPFPKGSMEHQDYMMEMGRLWNEAFKREMQELRAGL